MKRAMAAAIAASLLGGLSAAPALAQNSSSAPVDISADEQETISSQCKTIFRGAVEVLQETSRLRAAKMTLYNQKKAKGGDGGSGCGNVDRVEAEGEVFYVTPKQTVRGDRATYDYASNTIVVTGNVIAIQGQDVARGDRMVVNTKTNDVRMESTTKGAGKKNRVRAVVYPSTSDDANKPKP